MTVAVSSKSSLSSRERVKAAVAGLPIDRVPVMYWINPHAACKLIANFQPAKNKFQNFIARRFWKRFAEGGGWLSEEWRNALPLLLQVYANSDYLLELGADLANTPFGSPTFWGRVYRENKHLRVQDLFGSVRGMGGIYLDIIKPGVKTARELRDLPLPDASADKHYAFIRKFRAKHPEACLFSDNFGVQDLPATNIWEMSQFMMALYDAPDDIKAFQQRFADWMIGIARRSVKAGADIVFIYDDYGYTNRTLISMEMWKEFTYPHLRRQIEAVHDAGALAMLHSCGYQMPFLEFYVEAGLDIIQTFQPKAGNDFKTAYEKYGDRLTFNTGIDIQLGEMMAPAQVRDAILDSYRIAGMNGRHILGMTHMLQYTMPDPNIRAILDTVRRIQAGEYD